MDIQDTSTKILLVVVIVLVGLFITGAVFWGAQTPTAGTTTTVDTSKVTSDGEPFIGNSNAPVTVTEWFDYQCPACKAFELTTLPSVVQNYVDTGKVKIVFKDESFLGPDSMVDAEYGRAVWALYPSEFAAWRDAIYTLEPQENTLNAADNIAFLKKVLGSVTGIDVNKVTAAVVANQAAYDAAINADKAEGTSLGINATPSFVIGGKLITGGYPYTTFQSLVDPLLK